MNVLFVCTGNTCRSPMAEKILQKKAKENQIDLQVKSAGIAAFEGQPASKHARQVMKDYGMDDRHQTRRVSKELLEWADLILTMTEGHKSVLIDQYPEFAEKVYTLKEYTHRIEGNREWEKLNEIYQRIEEKKERFLIQHQKEMDELENRYQMLQQEMKEIEAKLQQYQQLLQKEIETELKEIEQLRKSMPSYDIDDPFGGDLDIYRKTAKEIEEAIDKWVQFLIAKSINKEGE
ncbi:low molecular weight protein arginine phosphatase [Tepidibacillus sp. LV47]|uniref:low molecular weight protein arginine phosphatase n=1 Tax=Tepidibacillus sp. LV47 TaxID=3398228 RepID=UPI003AAA9D01